MAKLEEVPLVEVKGKKLNAKEFLDFLLLRDRLKDVREFALESLIMDHAKDEGIKVTDAELQKQADSVRLSMGLFKKEDFTSFLDNSHLSLEDYEKKLEASILRGKLRDKVIKEKDVEKAFFENKMDYDRATLSRIIVGDQGLAKEIVNSIREKEATFEELARKHTLIEAERPSGGFQGTFTRARVHPSMRSAVFSGKRGTVVGPVKVGTHHHVDYVHEIMPAELTPELKEQIREELFKNWLDDMAGKSGVNILI